LYCGIVHFSDIAIAHLGALASIAPWYCMSPAFLGGFLCSAVIQIIKNTRAPEKFHAQIFSSRKLRNKEPTSIKKRFKYFREMAVVFYFFLFFAFKCHFSFFLRFFNQRCSKWFFSWRAILPHLFLLHSLCSSPALTQRNQDTKLKGSTPSHFLWSAAVLVWDEEVYELEQLEADWCPECEKRTVSCASCHPESATHRGRILNSHQRWDSKHKWKLCLKGERSVRKHLFFQQPRNRVTQQMPFLPCSITVLKGTYHAFIHKHLRFK